MAAFVVFLLLGSADALLAGPAMLRWRSLAARFPKGEEHTGKRRHGWSGPDGGFALSEGEKEPQQGISDIPLLLELLGASIGAGLPLVRALELAAASAQPIIRHPLAIVVSGLSIGASWHASWRAAGDIEEASAAGQLRRALDFAAATGAPSAALLFSEAARIRRSRHRVAEQKAAALGVALVLPLGLCFLPAFICFGVVPVVASLLPSFR